MTLRRYGHCVSDLPPYKDSNFNELDFLVNQMRLFLDQANYDNEQLANISALMDNICFRTDKNENSYPISMNIDVSKYNKDTRCKAIDEAMDAMYYVFKRASLNKSEPLDFSVIQFYPNATNKEASFHLTDLINTSWIKAEVMLEHVCKITDSVKEYVQSRSSNSTAQDRSQQQHSGYINSMMDFLDRLLDPILGPSRRFYLEGTNTVEIVYSTLSNQLGNLRDSIGSRYKSTRGRLASMFTSNQLNSTVATNSTLKTALNATVSTTVAAATTNSTNTSQKMNTESPSPIVVITTTTSSP